MGLLIADKKITIKAFQTIETLDENTYYELIDGEIVKKSAPHYLHQRVSGKIFLKLQTFVSTRKLGEAFFAPIDVFLNEINAYQPDLIYISEARKSILTDEGVVEGSPDLVIEILSPSTGKLDRGKKMQVYELNNVQEYWIVDLANQIVEVYVNDNQRFTLFSYAFGKENIVSRILKELNISAAELFE